MLRNMPQGAKERVAEISSRPEKPKFGGAKTRDEEIKKEVNHD